MNDLDTFFNILQTLCFRDECFSSVPWSSDYLSKWKQLIRGASEKSLFHDGEEFRNSIIVKRI